MLRLPFKLITIVLFSAFIFFALLLVLTTTLFVSLQQVFAAHARVDLLTADNFAILAGTAITDTGTTAIIGDVGLSPDGGGADITGLTCAEVTGTIYDTDGGYTGGGGGSTACLETNPGLLTTAKSSLTTAYNDAAGRTTTSTIDTELGGVTLTDGTYDSASGTFEIATAETLTLDGEGNADAVFIFQMASTLVTGSSSEVILINGAQECNVYWQVGSSATLGTSTELVGNVLALTTITDDGGSIVNGRLLARNGAVNLNNSTVTVQTCAEEEEPTPTPTPTPAVSSDSSSSLSAPSSATDGNGPCVEPEITTTPLILTSTRTSPTSVYITWGPFAGLYDFNVRYGTTNGDWLYNTNVTGFSTTINDLPANQPIWIQVAARNNCAIGTYSEPRLVGSPALPNAGFEPQKHVNMLYLPIGIMVAFLILIKFIKLRRA